MTRFFQGIVVILLAMFYHVLPAFSAQPILGKQELLRLVSDVAEDVDAADLLDVTYADVTGDGVPELFVGVATDQMHRSHFLIYIYRNGQYKNVLHDAWRSSYFGMELVRVLFPGQTRISTLTVVTYSPEFGTGWQPKWKDVLWWNGKEFRTVWSGPTDVIDVATRDGKMVNSLVRFEHEKGTFFMELIAVQRTITADGSLGKVKLTTVRRYKWDDRLSEFVDIKPSP